MIDYLNIAKEACKNVFLKDYRGLLSLPQPEIKLLTPIDNNYPTGEYKISIGDRWQIELNFGKLPTEKKEFIEEVKVILCHEIEHYRTCPFSVIYHLRMLNKALEITKDIKLSANIANQVADIIVDTVNFHKYPESTVKSEKNWIKSNSKNDFQSLPKSSKLMFLVKQALWKVKLVEETDENLLQIAQNLADVFLEDKIDSRKTLIKKVAVFSTQLIEVLKEDIEKDRLTMPSPKGQKGEGQGIIFLNQPEVLQAVQQFAQETTLENFEQILQITGLAKEYKDDMEIKKIWYEQKVINRIEIPFEVENKSEQNMLYPITWRISDSIEELDILLSLQTSPCIIPNLTTKKWVKNESDMPSDRKGKPDLLIIIDSSGSMKWDSKDEKSEYHIALISAFSLLKYCEETNGIVSGINFSNTPIGVDWTKEYDKVKRLFLTHQNNGTTFPIEKTNELIIKKQGKKVITILTDDELTNWDTCQAFFSEVLNDGNKVLIFLIRKDHTDMSKYKGFLNCGGKIYTIQKPEDIYNTVIEEL